MTREEAAMKLATHYMSCGMLMPLGWLDKNGEGSELFEAVKMAMDVLNGKDTNVPTSGWISVEDRLPKPGQMVLVYCRSRMVKKHITVSTYMKDYSHARCCYWSRRVRDVTHWMPLPEPPEVEG